MELSNSCILFYGVRRGGSIGYPDVNFPVGGRGYRAGYDQRVTTAMVGGGVDDTGCVDGRCYVRVGGDCLGCFRRNGEWTLDLYFV